MVLPTPRETDMAYTVLHTQVGSPAPHWYELERWQEAYRERAIRRARDYALNHGGYVCVKDHTGGVVFGTDPAALERAILAGMNRDFAKSS